MSKSQNLLFIQSVISKDVKKAEEHLSKGSDINAIGGTENISALHYATLQGDIEMIKWLLEHGANLLVKGGSGGQIPFHVACMQGNLQLVELFYEEFEKFKAEKFNDSQLAENETAKLNDSSVEDQSTEPENVTLDSSLNESIEGDMNEESKFEASRAQSRDLVLNPPVEKNKKRKANPLTQSSKNSAQTIHVTKRRKISSEAEIKIASINKDTKIVNIQDDNGWTPIICAANFSHYHIMEYLLKQGADINQTDLKKRNALQFVIANSPKTVNLNTIIFLLENGCNVNHQDKDKRTALHLAVSNNANNEIIKYLILYGVDTNAKDKRENTASFIAKEMSHPEIANYILMIKEIKEINLWMTQRINNGKSIP